MTFSSPSLSQGCPEYNQFQNPTMNCIPADYPGERPLGGSHQFHDEDEAGALDARDGEPDHAPRRREGVIPWKGMMFFRAIQGDTSTRAPWLG